MNQAGFDGRMETDDEKLERWDAMMKCPSSTHAGYNIVESVEMPGDDIQQHGWMVIARLPHNELHPFVTWWMNDKRETSGGEYCTTLEEAQTSLKRRSQ